MEKNYFAAVEYRTGVAFGLGIGGMLFWGVALAGPLLGGTPGIAAGAAMLSLSLPAGLLARRLGWSWFAAVDPARGEICSSAGFKPLRTAAKAGVKL